LENIPLCCLLPYVVLKMFVWSSVFFTSVKLITLTFHTEVFPTSSSSEHSLHPRKKAYTTESRPYTWFMSCWSVTGSIARAGKRYKGQRDYFSVRMTTTVLLLLLNIVSYSYGCQNYVKQCKVAWWRPQPATPYTLEEIYRRFGGTS
jgi:hypothetical protein